jgi:hypothetical protein
MSYEEEFGLVDEDIVQIRDLLEILAELRAERSAKAAPFAERIAALEEERDAATAELDEQIAAMEAAVKRAVVAHGESVEAQHMRAIYVKPRITWDNQRLEGYAEAHPEIKAFRRVGNPSVRLMEMK